MPTARRRERSRPRCGAVTKTIRRIHQSACHAIMPKCLCWTIVSSPCPWEVAASCFLPAPDSCGYLHREDLTNERFLFQRVNGSAAKRLYKTGDLGRRRPDGAIEFVGRRDRQVKVRGFRVEMDEVEYCLRSHPQVAQAAVRQLEGDMSHPRLVAYYVPERDQAIAGTQLRDWLRSQLPDYMLPAHLVALDSLTYDANGKIDYKALPTPHELLISRAHRVLPRSRLEIALAKIWCEVLGIDEVGIHDHFVELGGDSLLSVQVTNQANEQGLRLTSSQVFEHPTIAELARVLES